MSKVIVETTITRVYLRHKTKEEIIDHVMRLLREEDELLMALKTFYRAFNEYHALGRLELLGNALSGQRRFVAAVVEPLLAKYEVLK